MRNINKIMKKHFQFRDMDKSKTQESSQVFRKHASFAPASQSLPGFRLRSPLKRGTLPAQPSYGFLNHPTADPIIYLQSLKRKC